MAAAPAAGGRSTLVRAGLVLATIDSTIALAARADAFVYWANNLGTTIGRANLDGSNANQSFITGASSPVGVAVDDAHIYWVNGGTDTIGRADLDGDPTASPRA